jgi:hypothetical protein
MCEGAAVRSGLWVLLVGAPQKQTLPLPSSQTLDAAAAAPPLLLLLLPLLFLINQDTHASNPRRTSAAPEMAARAAALV